MTSRRVRRSVRSTASLALSGVCISLGMAMVARMPMMATTMISSSSVKPCSLRRCRNVFIRLAICCIRLPFTIGRAVDAGAAGERVDVINVFAPPDPAAGRVLIAAQPPLRLAGHRVDGDAAQELRLLVDLADDVAACYQRVELLRVAVGAEVDGDHAGVAVALVVVDGVAHLAQRRLELGLLHP